MSDTVQIAFENLVAAVAQRERGLAREGILAMLGGGPGVRKTRGVKANGVAPKAAKAERQKGAKRSPEQLAKLTEKLLTHVKANKGQNIETIGNALKVATKDLALPVAKLFEAKKLKSTGNKRATRYYAR